MSDRHSTYSETDYWESALSSQTFSDSRGSARSFQSPEDNQEIERSLQTYESNTRKTLDSYKMQVSSISIGTR